MFIKKLKTILWLVVASFIAVSLWTLPSCTDEGDEELTGEDSTYYQEFSTKDKKFKDYGLPSPLELAVIIKKSGSNYNTKVLNPVSNVSNYSTSFNKSLNVGVYGTDLGYVSIYGQTQDAITYLNTVKTLADDLGIMGAYEKETFDRIQENLGNQDSLVTIVTEAFANSDTYLKKNERNSTSALILAGGWIEAVYIATQMVKSNPDKAIVNRIGEQKIVLNILRSLINQYKDESDEFTDLYGELEDLKKIFDEVKIEYTYPDDKDTVITDVAAKRSEIMIKSTVTITDGQLKNISDKIATLRNNIIS